MTVVHGFQSGAAVNVMRFFFACSKYNGFATFFCETIVGYF